MKLKERTSLSLSVKGVPYQVNLPQAACLWISESSPHQMSFEFKCALIRDTGWIFIT